MNKPLSISNTPAAIEKDKLNIRSVTQVINLFNLKSPRQKSSTIRQRSSSAAKSMTSPRNILLARIKPSTCFDTLAKVTSLNLQNKSERSRSSKKASLESEHKHNQNFSSVLTINLKEAIKKTHGSAHQRDQFRKKTVTRLMKQMGQFDVAKKPKDNKPKIPTLKIKEVHKFNRPKPLSDRLNHDTPQDIQKQRLNTTRSTKSIKAQSRQSNNSLKAPEADLFFRKESSSTLSLKSKHMHSIQYYQDDQELFSKEPSKQLLKFNEAQALTALQQVKSKIYSQINALDKKLLTEKIRSESGKHLKISLKKRNPVQVETKEQEQC